MGKLNIRPRLGPAPHPARVSLPLTRLASRLLRDFGGCTSILESLDEISRALRVALPDLDLAGLRIVDTGFGSTVLETGEGVIVRVGRTTAAARGHAVEAACLPGLAPRLPVRVPVPVYLRAPGGPLPFGAIAYPRLPGEQCQPGTATEVTGRELGALLAVLHRVDARAFPALPGPQDVWEGWLRLRHESSLVLQRRMTGHENGLLGRWWEEFLTDQGMRHYRPAVRHGDLWFGNILIGPGGAVTAALDWEALANADPAQDLALTRYLGDSFTAVVLEAYCRHGGLYDRDVQHRADRHWELRELTGIPLAASVGDDEEIGECIAKLRAGPILG
jgi:aminoglycoside 2''-phosphotransferase